MHVKDVHVIPYSSKWGWKYATSIVQKIYKTKEDALFYAAHTALKHETDLYIEDAKGKLTKLNPKDYT